MKVQMNHEDIHIHCLLLVFSFLCDERTSKTIMWSESFTIFSLYCAVKGQTKKRKTNKNQCSAMHQSYATPLEFLLFLALKRNKLHPSLQFYILLHQICGRTAEKNLAQPTAITHEVDSSHLSYRHVYKHVCFLPFVVSYHRQKNGIIFSENRTQLSRFYRFENNVKP